MQFSRQPISTVHLVFHCLSVPVPNNGSNYFYKTNSENETTHKFRCIKLYALTKTRNNFIIHSQNISFPCKLVFNFHRNKRN